MVGDQAASIDLPPFILSISLNNYIIEIFVSSELIGDPQLAHVFTPSNGNSLEFVIAVYSYKTTHHSCFNPAHDDIRKGLQALP